MGWSELILSCVEHYCVGARRSFRRYGSSGSAEVEVAAADVAIVRLDDRLEMDRVDGLLLLSGEKITA